MNDSLAESSAVELPTADWTKHMRPSMLYRLARLFGMNRDIISFAGGAPDPHLFPTAELVAAATQTMSNNARSLQYGRDVPLLKEHVRDLMGRRGVTCNLDNISITAGGQHAMDILTRLFLNPLGEVMLEELVYTGILQTVMPFQPRIWPIPIDAATGLDVDKIGELLEDGARPAFLYTIPEAHNPAGVSLSGDKRRQLVALARHFQMPIIEDDAYGFLNYDDEHTVALRALDEEWVIYMGTFSKILAPGLRLGWIVSPPSLTDKVQEMKRLSMLSVAPLSQHIVATYLAANDFPAHIKTIRQQYGRRRDVMLEAIAEYFPAEAEWTRPNGGLFIWVKLPEWLDTEALVYQAVEEEGVAYIPGKAFVTDPQDHRYDSCMRLSFARDDTDVIVEGIARLGRVLKKAIMGHTISQTGGQQS